MMDESKRAVNYTAKRLQAIRNMEQHIQKILFPKAKQIVSKAKKYQSKGKLGREKKLLSEARAIAQSARQDIERYIDAYAKTSCKLLGVSQEGVSKLLTGNIYGRTIEERNIAYLNNFAEDIVRMIKAGTLMNYSDSKLLSAIRTGYKNPYKASVVTKAQRKDINISSPSYGKGIYRNAYENIVRNATQVISLAFGLAEQEYGKSNGAVGFRSYRASSYPCAVCDDEASYLHKFGDPYPPYHIACVCYTKFVYEKE